MASINIFILETIKQYHRKGRIGIPKNTKATIELGLLFYDRLQVSASRVANPNLRIRLQCDTANHIACNLQPNFLDKSTGCTRKVYKYPGANVMISNSNTTP